MDRRLALRKSNEWKIFIVETHAKYGKKSTTGGADRKGLCDGLLAQYWRVHRYAWVMRALSYIDSSVCLPAYDPKMWIIQGTLVCAPHPIRIKV